MKFTQLQGQFSMDCWGTLNRHDQPLAPGPVALRAGKQRGEIGLAQDGLLVSFTLREPAQANRLEQYLYSGAAHLAQIVMVKESALQLAVRFYHGGPLQFAEIDITFDDAAITACTRHGVRGARPEEILRQLESEMVYAPKGSDCGAFVLQPADQPEGAANASPDQLERGFTMLGNGFHLEVILQQHDDAGLVFVARRVVPARTAHSGPIRLATGQVRFLDHTRLGQLRPLAQAAMARLTRNAGSYFRAWDEYGRMEGAMLLERARTVGILVPESMESVPGGTRFFIQGGVPTTVPAALDQVDILTVAPSYLQDPALDWEDYCAEVAQRKGTDDTRLASAAVLECTEHAITLRLPFDGVLKQGRLVLSMQGELTQITRRKQARELILSGRCANPLLGLLIEKDGDLPRAARPPRIEPLSPQPSEKARSRPPTERQVLAIELALNTPDIMVIQGPPGTGKTTVITAIIERLNEVRDKRASGKGEVLVTAHQHDAVDNVLSRLTIDGRPAVKFGRKGGVENDDAPVAFDNWSGELAANIRAAHPAMRQSELQQQLGRQAGAYMAAPSLARAAALLRHIALLPPEALDDELAERDRVLLQEIVEEMDADHDLSAQAVRALHALRTSAAGFADDGARGAGAVLVHCQARLDRADTALLDQALEWTGPQAPPFLAALAGLKSRLLGRYCKPAPFRFDKPRDDVLMLLAGASRALEQYEQANGDPIAAVLAGFVHELEGNPAGVAEALSEYSFVYAATCQGCDGGAIKQAKRGAASARDAVLEYDTVIIDEAARVSPRDLLIPMAQGLRRIILVGDHRQLPHIVEEEIIRQLDAGEQGASVLKQSAFQYLRERAIALERRDGIVRTVTLNRQYRMHSLLGKFVSAQFYDAHGEGFESPDNNTPYRHTLPGTDGRPLAWLDVPQGAGPEDVRPPKSWYRKVEAEKIVEQLHAWIQGEEGGKLSFGIITFYRAQVDEIYKALAQKGYAERTPSGEWTIAPRWREKIGDAERLRVGTVDAFQGMEFDVVFLSIVRSPAQQRPNAPVRKAGGVFGRLQTESLQCVAMSRQKRLLVVAGDSGLLDHALAPQAVPALHALRELCRREGVRL